MSIYLNQEINLKGGPDALFNIVINYVLFVENILSSIWQFWKEQLDIKLSCICVDLNTQLINVQLVNFVLQTIAVIKEQLIKLQLVKEL